MSRATHIISAPYRLARAMRAKGVGPVLNFLVLTVRRRGALDAMRLGLVDRGRREAEADDEFEWGRPRGHPGRPADLDEDYGLGEAAWTARVQRVSAAALAVDPLEDAFPDAEVAFVVQGAGAEAVARTRAAIRDLGPELTGAAADQGGASAERWTVFLKGGDIPSAELPREIARAARGGIAEVVSFDMVRREAGRVFPLLAPGANPTLLASVDYLFGRVALRGGALPKDDDLAGLDPRQAVLAWLAAQPPLQARGRWRHVGRPLVQADLKAAEIVAERDLALAQGRRPVPPPEGGVSAVICTRDKGHLTRQLVRSLLARPASQVAEVIIVANGTTNPYALATLEDLGADPRVQVLRQDGAFNFSKLCNAGVAASRRGGPLLFLNDDLAPVAEDWLARLAHRLGPAEVGAVGALLLYPDETVQHAGMYLGYRASAGHTLRGARLPDEDYLFTAVAPREVSCLTGAVLLVRREAFEAVGGFDDQLATYLQDVDLCLRLRRSGWLNVFEPSAVLIHMESASIRELDRTSAFHRQRQAEHQRFTQRWGDSLARDPHHPSGFDLQDETLRRLAAPGGAAVGGQARGRPVEADAPARRVSPPASRR